MSLATGGMISGTLEYLRRPLVRNIEAGKKVLVLSDFDHDPRVWQAVMTILADIGADATLTLFERRPADYYDPPSAVVEAMMKSDFNILLASTGMLHSSASFNAMAAGIPSICMDGGMTLEMFQSGAVTDDMRMIAVRKHYVSKNVFGSNARMCRVTSDYGTDFTYSVENRITLPPLPGSDFDQYKIIDFAKDENRPGNNLLYYLFPTGEFNVAPVEGSANGKLVIDLTMHHIGRLLTPIELTVKDGRVVGIDGGPEARILRDYLETYGDENAYMCPAEASIGVNAKAVVRGIQREDKNIWGTLHFGLGTNVDVGGSIKSKIHMDGVILHPTLEVDGVKKIERGRFLVPIEREMD
ncbi:aminopeptidase [Chelativorans sp. Marseille-P2723]|uniref:aminopeptidase n=1 Tax=Chelativorans sp. Marseille-P2723 TaxID=2709133 RepID=UPI00156D4C60|nr:aminopeptidase [Chelativorans sp. Marseille-P2723]